MSDCLTSLDPEYCPDLDDCHAELRALLPTGKAWDAAHRSDTVLWRFWRAVAHPLAFAHRRICDLRRQFWCATTDELHDAWLVEYGLPDACDPFPELCAKVAALGGTRCDYYEALGARAGWSIACLAVVADCGGRMDLMRADCASVGGDAARNRLVFEVSLPDSPAYTSDAAGPIVTDCSVTDAVMGCEPDIGPLVCLIERVVPAHVEVVYRLV